MPLFGDCSGWGKWQKKMTKCEAGEGREPRPLSDLALSSGHSAKSVSIMMSYVVMLPLQSLTGRDCLGKSLYKGKKKTNTRAADWERKTYKQAVNHV